MLVFKFDDFLVENYEKVGVKIEISQDSVCCYINKMKFTINLDLTVDIVIHSSKIIDSNDAKVFMKRCIKSICVESEDLEGGCLIKMQYECVKYYIFACRIFIHKKFDFGTNKCYFRIPPVEEPKLLKGIEILEILMTDDKYLDFENLEFQNHNMRVINEVGRSNNPIHKDDLNELIRLTGNTDINDILSNADSVYDACMVNRLRLRVKPAPCYDRFNSPIKRLLEVAEDYFISVKDVEDYLETLDIYQVPLKSEKIVRMLKRGLGQSRIKSARSNLQ
jgi:hypothetical protein